MAEGEVRKNVNAVEFAKAVRESDTIEQIMAVTGLKRTTVSTKLTGLRKLVGAENVKSFKRKGQVRINKDAVLAALRGE